MAAVAGHVVKSGGINLLFELQKIINLAQWHNLLPKPIENCNHQASL